MRADRHYAPAREARRSAGCWHGPGVPRLRGWDPPDRRRNRLGTDPGRANPGCLPLCLDRNRQLTSSRKRVSVAAVRLRGVLLLVGAVARAHERAGEDGAETERLSLLAEPAELVRMDPAVDRRVLRARLEVLADCHHVDAVR